MLPKYVVDVVRGFGLDVGAVGGDVVFVVPNKYHVDIDPHFHPDGGVPGFPHVGLHDGLPVEAGLNSPEGLAKTIQGHLLFLLSLACPSKFGRSRYRP